MTLIEKVEKKYGSLNEEWVAEKGKVQETRLIRELAIALKKTQQRLNNTEGRVDELWRKGSKAKVEQENILNLYKRRTQVVINNIEQMRDNIDHHVAQLEDAIAEHDKQLETNRVRYGEDQSNDS